MAILTINSKNRALSLSRALGLSTMLFLTGGLEPCPAIGQETSPSNPSVLPPTTVPTTFPTTVPTTLTEWCLQQELATPEQQHLIDILQELSSKGTCEEVSEHFYFQSALTINNMDISDLSVLESLSLFNLNLAGNQITDVSPLTRLPNLLYLNLTNNQISDVEPFFSMPSLKRLHLSGNPIADPDRLADLANRVELYIYPDYPNGDSPALLPLDFRSPTSLVPEDHLGTFSGVATPQRSIRPGQISHVYEFEMGHMGYFEAVLDPIASDELTMSVYLKTAHDAIALSPDEGYITSATEHRDGQQTLTLHGLGEGTYYFVLKRKEQIVDTPIDYTVSLSQADGWPHMEQESNNDVAHAQRRHPDRQLPLIGAWHVQGDVETKADPMDYWQFTLNRPSHLHIHLAAEDDGAVVELYDVGGSPLPLHLNQTVVEQRQARLDPLPAGTYYAQVRATDGNPPSPYPKTYNLMLEGIPLRSNTAPPS